jgi:hypothetical protein
MKTQNKTGDGFTLNWWHIKIFLFSIRLTTSERNNWSKKSWRSFPFSQSPRRSFLNERQFANLRQFPHLLLICLNLSREALNNSGLRNVIFRRRIRMKRNTHFLMGQTLCRTEMREEIPKTWRKKDTGPKQPSQAAIQIVVRPADGWITPAFREASSLHRDDRSPLSEARSCTFHW